jgi:beta-glucosidase-like glycosyl hydrolase/CubicO group peptidase (beta-lactamase class C family)
MAELTPEERIAQLFSARAMGFFKSLDDPDFRDLVALVDDFKIGGLIFFQGDPLAQAAIINDLQERADVPLLISQDMEGGAGMRIDNTTNFPRTMAVGASRNADYAYAVGYVTAQEARALGTQHVYAPVADVNNNPANPIINVRAFGEDPQLVAEMATAHAQGLQAGGTIATAKHFPGHGDTATDSHYDLPVITHDRERLDAVELVPFREAIAGGLQSVMVAHIAFPELEADSTVPATLSRPVVTGLLREDLGFDGLIVTDGLDMAGVTKYFPPGDAAVRALEAGVDVLLLSSDPYAARAAIIEAIANGRLTQERIDESARRVLEAKARVGLHRERMVDLGEARSLVGTQANLSLSESIARDGLTLLRNEGDLLPLTGAPKRVLSVALSDSRSGSAGGVFHRALRDHGTFASLETHVLDARSDQNEYRLALTRAADADVVLVPTYLPVRSWSNTIGLSEAHKAFLNELIDQGTPVVLIAFGNPYMSMGVSEPAAFLVAYGGTESLQVATAKALAGQSRIGGKLPITIPGQYAYGEGLDVEQHALRMGEAEEVGMDGRVLARIDTLLSGAVHREAFPGAALAVGRAGVLVKLRGYGYHTYAAETPITPQSTYDLASLTKVVATTTAAMQLYEAGRLDLDAPVADFLPRFAQSGKSAVTVRNLLAHDSGMRPFRRFYAEDITTRQGVIDAILAEPLIFETGSETRYSDFNMIALQLVIEEITGEDLASYAEANIFEPLGMTQTGFLGTGTPDPEVVPTEDDTYFRNRLMQGEVHDETAWLLGGTAGHAGLFSTAYDLAKYAHMITSGGRVYGEQFLQPETIRLFTTRIDPEGSTRALGWDTKSLEGYSSAGQRFGPRSFGHTGFTGTSMWIDPEQDLFVILLTNRVYPTRDNRGHIPIRPAVADLAYEAIVGEATPVMPRRGE